MSAAPGIADHSHAYEDVELVLDGFRAAGARLLVCTNKRTDLSTALLGALSLLDRFDAVVGPDRVSARKPDLSRIAATRATARAPKWISNCGIGCGPTVMTPFAPTRIEIITPEKVDVR